MRRTVALTVFLLLVFWTADLEAQDARETGRRIQRLFPELIGTDEAVRSQNRRADAEGIGPVHDPAELVPVQVSEDLSLRLTLARERPLHRRSFRDWVVGLIVELASFHRETVRKPLQLNDGTRTVGEQAWLTQLVPVRVKGKRLLLPRNPNAAPVEGEKASLHIRGISADFLATGNFRDEKPFAEHLAAKEQEGCLDATREIAQPVYHVVFYPRCLVPAIASGAGPH